MRILHIINTLTTGGAEKLLSDIAHLMNSEGYKTDILVFQGGKSHFTELLINKNVIVKSLNASSVYSIRLIFKIIPLLKQYDIVHVHLFPAQYWVVIAKLLRFSSVKLVTTEHCTSNNRRKKIGFRLIDRMVYKCYKKIISVSQETQDSLIGWLKSANKDKFCVIENGIPLTDIEEAKPYSKIDLGITENDKVIVMTGRLEPQKDHSTLLKAIAKLPTNIHLFLAGDGILRPKYEKMANDLSITERTHFLGIRNDIPRLIKSADICVLSSHFEGLSLAAIEGMAAGPFVASDVNGLRDLVNNAGVLFPENDYIALAKILSNLLSNQTYYDRIKTQCLNRAKNYDIGNMVKKYIDVYKSL